MTKEAKKKENSNASQSGNSSDSSSTTNTTKSNGSSGGGGGGYSSGGYSSGSGGSSKSTATTSTTTVSNQVAKYGADKVAQANSKAANRMGVNQLKRDADESLSELKMQLEAQDKTSQANQQSAYRDADTDWQTGQIKDMQMLSNLRNSSTGYGSMGNSLSYLYNETENNQDTEILNTLNQNLNNQFLEDYETNNKNIMSYNQAIQKDYDSAVSYAGTYLDEFNNNNGYKTVTKGKDKSYSKSTTTSSGTNSNTHTYNKTNSNSTSTTTHNKSKYINYKTGNVNEDKLFKDLGFTKNTFKTRDYIKDLTYLGNTRTAADTASTNKSYDNRAGKTNLW